MATYARWTRTITDDAGNVRNAKVYVYKESDGLLATIYSDRAGATPLANPFTLSNSDRGLAFFHAVGAPYKVVAVDGSWSQTWRYQALGTSAEYDVGSFIGSGQSPATVNTIAALKALATATYKIAVLNLGKQSGTFVFLSGNYSSHVTADTLGGVYLKADDTSSSSGAWVRIFTDKVFPEWFGAAADGTTDDRATIQAAIDLVQAVIRGGTVKLRSATYIIGSQLTLPNTNGALSSIVFEGDGDQSIIKGGASYSGHYLDVGSLTLHSGFRAKIRNVKFVAPVSGTASWGIEAHNSNGMIVEWVYYSGIAGGLVMADCYSVYVANCTHETLTNQSIYSTTAAHGLVVRNCGFFNCAYTSGSQVIRVDVLSYVLTFEENDFEGVGELLHIADARSLTFCRNYHEDSTVQLFGFSGTSYNVLITDNYFSAATVTTTINNINGLEFRRNAQYGASFAFGGSVSRLEVQQGSLESGSTITGGNVSQFIFASAIDTDGTLAANSDTRVPSQKAVKTYVGSWASVSRASGFDTFAATPSSSNLKALLTDETGSGAAVFAQSPSLVTPDIGAATGASLSLSKSGASNDVLVNEQTGGFNADIAFQSAGTTKWQMGKDGSNNFFYYDNAGGRNVMTIAGGGDMTLMPAGGGVKVGGWFGRGAPVTKTGDFTVAGTENSLINNKSGSTCTVTLPAASSFTGREILIKTIQAQTVVSASSNVVPAAGGAAGTAILAATAGKWALLISDGTNWIIMASN